LHGLTAKLASPPFGAGGLILQDVIELRPYHLTAHRAKKLTCTTTFSRHMLCHRDRFLFYLSTLAYALSYALGGATWQSGIRPFAKFVGVLTGD
jgi:hypothetical protein